MVGSSEGCGSCGGQRRGNTTTESSAARALRRQHRPTGEPAEATEPDAGDAQQPGEARPAR